MIALLFSWVLLAVVFYTFGRASLQLWNLVAKKGDQYSSLDTILIGMCATASTIAIFSIWIPANTMLLFALAFICIFYWIINNKSIPKVMNGLFDFLGQQSKLHLPIYAIMIVAIGMFCTLHPVMTDTLYYHYQNLMWNEQYAVVPGLANLQPRFAFNSSFFLLGSTFGLKPLFGQYIFGTHTFLLTAIYLWVVYKTLHTKNIIRSVIAITMLTCLFIIYKVHITSITTDFIPNLLIAYLILKVIFDENSIKERPFLFFILPIFIITLKLSCFSIVILPLYVLWMQIKESNYKNLAVLAFGALFIIVPWCVRTVILSGYLIFPFPYIDLFSFDWKIPVEYAIEQKEFIQAFAKYPNNIDIQYILSIPITQWFPIWWKSDMFYYNPIANRLFFWLTIITIPMGAVLVAKAMKAKKQIALVLLWIACLLGIVVWFFNAPDFRFIYSLILGQCFISILLLTEHFMLKEKIKKRVEEFPLQIVLIIITTIFVGLYSARWIYYQKGEPLSKLIKVPSSIAYTRESRGLPADTPFYSVEVNGIKIYRMSPSDRDVLCLDCKLPCSADYVGGIEMRGKTLQEGFRCKPNAPHRLTY